MVSRTTITRIDYTEIPTHEKCKGCGTINNYIMVQREGHPIITRCNRCRRRASKLKSVDIINLQRVKESAELLLEAVALENPREGTSLKRAWKRLDHDLKEGKE